MKTKKTIIIAFIGLFGATANTVRAQDIEVKDQTNALINTGQKGYTFFVRAGYEIGGTTPIPLAEEIRHIDKYAPGLHMMIEGDIHKQFTPQWGAMLGLRLENKGMETTADVKNYGMDMWQEGNRMVGYFTGTVETKANCAYLTIPITATYRVAPRWTLKAGPYFAYAFRRDFSGTVYNGYLRVDEGKMNGTTPTGPTGQKVEITKENPATYDFSDDMRPFNWGLEVGADWRAFTHLNVFAHLDWGLNGAFRSNFDVITFTMHPIYATVGFAYAF